MLPPKAERGQVSVSEGRAAIPAWGLVGKWGQGPWSQDSASEGSALGDPDQGLALEGRALEALEGI